MNDKNLEHISDVTESEVFSSCCTATVIMGDICSACKEHCDPIYEDKECPNGCDDGISADSGCCLGCGLAV